MHGAVRISDAATIAIHAGYYLAAQDGTLKQAAEIAADLGVSRDHLSKVLQRLTKAGLVLPVRGPKGGFALTPAGRGGRLRDFVSAVDGLPAPGTCLLKKRICGGKGCLFGDFLAETHRRFEAALDKKISERADKK